MLSRRGLLGVFLAAPVVIWMPHLLMPIKSWSPVADRIKAMWRSGLPVIDERVTLERGLVVSDLWPFVSMTRCDLDGSQLKPGETMLTVGARIGQPPAFLSGCRFDNIGDSTRIIDPNAFADHVIRTEHSAVRWGPHTLVGPPGNAPTRDVING